MRNHWNNLSREDKAGVVIFVEFAALAVFVATLYVLRTNGVV